MQHPITVVDDYLAEFWRKVFTKLQVHPDIPLRTGGTLAVGGRNVALKPGVDFAARPSLTQQQRSLDAPLVFVGIIFVALAGSALARFEARGMARAALAAFALTALIAAVTPVFGWGADEPPGTSGLTVLIAGFAALWGLSSALFAKAAHDTAQV